MCPHARLTCARVLWAGRGYDRGGGGYGTTAQLYRHATMVPNVFLTCARVFTAQTVITIVATVSHHNCFVWPRMLPMIFLRARVFPGQIVTPTGAVAAIVTKWAHSVATPTPERQRRQKLRGVKKAHLTVSANASDCSSSSAFCAREPVPIAHVATAARQSSCCCGVLRSY